MYACIHTVTHIQACMHTHHPHTEADRQTGRQTERVTHTQRYINEQLYPKPIR